MHIREHPKPDLESGDLSSGTPQDDRLPVIISAYLDGELQGDELVLFEALLNENTALASEVAEMRHIERQLAQLGTDILSEPVPEALLKALAEFEGK